MGEKRSPEGRLLPFERPYPVCDRTVGHLGTMRGGISHLLRAAGQ